MTLREKLDNIKQAEIFKLIFEGKVVGLRVKSYNVNFDTFEYYDFTLKTISGNQAVKDFVNGLQSRMSCVELIEHGDIFASREEIDGSITVKEFKTEREALHVLGQVKQILEVMEG